MKLILDTINSSPTIITVKGKEIILLLIKSNIIGGTQYLKSLIRKRTVATKMPKSIGKIQN